MKKKILFFFLFFCVPLTLANASQEIKPQNFNKVFLVSVYDGDTFRVRLSCRYALFCQDISIRVRGVDCPEIRGGTKESKAAAKTAKEFTKDFLKSGKILLRNCGRDKYFRVLCDVKVNNKDLATELLAAHHAIPYKL